MIRRLHASLILNRSCLALLSAVVLGVACSGARAADEPRYASAFQDHFSNLLKADKLTGDWGGLRTQLQEKGVTFDITLTQVYQGVLNGGRSGSWQYGGRENLTINLDSQKMGLWPGGFLMIEAEGQYGEAVGIGQTGTVFPANINSLFPESGSSNVDLPAFMFTQFLSENIGFFAGKLDTMSGDANAFAHGKGSEKFLNTSFNFNPVAVVTVPYSALGGGMIILPTGKPEEAIITFTVLDSEGRPDTSGVDTIFSGGTTFGAEGRVATKFFGMTGHQTLGATYSDRLFTALDQDVANFIIPGLPIQNESGSWAVTYNFDQYVYQPDPKSDEGFGVFGRVGLSDGQANPIHWFLSAGIGGKGVIPGRKNDRFGIGYYYIVASDVQLADQLNFGDAMGGELFYEFEVTPWMYFTPDIQILKPSQGEVDCAAVLGFRLNMKF